MASPGGKQSLSAHGSIASIDYHPENDRLLLRIQPKAMPQRSRSTAPSLIYTLSYPYQNQTKQSKEQYGDAGEDGCHQIK